MANEIAAGALAEDARHNPRRALNSDINIDTLLYTDEGIKEALKVWGGLGGGGWGDGKEIQTTQRGRGKRRQRGMGDLEKL